MEYSNTNVTKRCIVSRDNYQYRRDSQLIDACKVIEYDPLTGSITRTDRLNSNGSLDKDGYLIMKIKGTQWKAHRLAWAKYYGAAPKFNIDHINRNKLDNRIENLRDVRQSVNVFNVDRQPNPDTGVVGIYLDKKTKGLLAKFTVSYNGKKYRFRDLNEAIKFKEMI